MDKSSDNNKDDKDYPKIEMWKKSSIDLLKRKNELLKKLWQLRLRMFGYRREDIREIYGDELADMVDQQISEYVEQTAREDREDTLEFETPPPPLDQQATATTDQSPIAIAQSNSEENALPQSGDSETVADETKEDESLPEFVSWINGWDRPVPNTINIGLVCTHVHLYLYCEFHHDVQ